MRLNLCCFIPDLVWPEPGDAEALDALHAPVLATLLARGRSGHRPRQSVEATLLELFGHADPAAHGAAWRRFGEATETTEADANALWLGCDPIHLRFHDESLILADANQIAVTADEMQACIGLLNAELGAWGDFQAASPERAYLRLAPGVQTADFVAPPPSAVAGRRVEHLLADAGGDWRVLFNDIQMLLHALPLNRQREAAGQVPINACWLWGAGTLPAQRRSAPRFTHVLGAEPLAHGLARADGVAPAALPASGADLFNELPRGNADLRYLAVLDALSPCVHYERAGEWRRRLEEIDARWLAPALKALAAGHLSQLDIVAPTSYAKLHWSIRRRDLLAFWRRPRPLQGTAAVLANTFAEQSDDEARRTPRTGGQE